MNGFQGTPNGSRQGYDGDPAAYYQAQFQGTPNASRQGYDGDPAAYYQAQSTVHAGSFTISGSRQDERGERPTHHFSQQDALSESERAARYPDLSHHGRLSQGIGGTNAAEARRWHRKKAKGSIENFTKQWGPAGSEPPPEKSTRSTSHGHRSKHGHGKSSKSTKLDKAMVGEGSSKHKAGSSKNTQGSHHPY